MNARCRSARWLTTCLAAATLALAGCASEPTTTRQSQYEGVFPGWTAGGPNSVPAAAPAPAQPRPAAAPTGWPTRRSTDVQNCLALAYPTGVANTSVVGVEKCLPREVRLNAPFEYDLVVTNLTSNELVDVVVGDEPGANLNITGSTPSGQMGADGMQWNLGAMKPNETRIIRVQATATKEGTVGTCAWVTYNTQLCATVPVVAPALKLVKTGPAEVLKCEAIEYRFEVTNSGTGSIDNVKITDTLPSGLTTASGQSSITFDAGTLAAGQSKPFTATVNASRAGRFENRATASGGGLTAESGVVATVVRQPVLTITKNCAEREFIGRPINADITVTNTGDGVARDTVLEDTLPAGAEFVSASDGGSLVGNKVVWTLGTMQPKGSKKVTLVYRTTAPGTMRNVASARAFCADTVTDDCSTVITGIPAVLLEVVDVEDPDLVGTTETYVVTVTNQGSAPATNVRITCTLEPNQEYVSSSGDSTGTARGATVTFEPFASIPPKGKATWRIVVRNVKAGDVRFKVSMMTDQLTRPVEETEATNVYE